MSLRNGRSKQACFQGENCRSGIAATKAGASGWASPRTHKSASVIDQEYPAKPARMLGSRPLSRTTAFAPRRDSRREKPFHQELPSLSVASPKHNPKLPILSISTCPAFSVPLSAFPLSAFPRFPSRGIVGFPVRGGPLGRSEERNGRQGGSACRWPQVFHTQAIRLRPMTLFNPVFNFVTPKGIKR